jgi:hypothetical protein
MFKISPKSFKRWLILGCLLFALSNLAVWCEPDEDPIPVWNEYSGLVSASPTDPNVALTSLRPGQSFYVWVYASSFDPRGRYFVVDDHYHVTLGGGVIVASSKPQCLGDGLNYYRCTEAWSANTRLVDILTVTVDEPSSLDLQSIHVLGEAYENGNRFVEQFLSLSIPLEKPELEVRYNGVPVASSDFIDLVVGENPFSVHNVSSDSLALIAREPRIRINGSISVRQGFPGGSVTLQPGESAPFALFCSGQGEPGLTGVLEIDNNSSGGQFSLRLLCDPAPLPALGNAPSDGGVGQIIVVTAEPPQPTEAPPDAGEAPPDIETPSP